MELDISPSLDGPTAREDYMALLHAVTVSSGVRPYFARGPKNDLQEASLVDVEEVELRVPFGAAAPDHLREVSVENHVGFCRRFCDLARTGGVDFDQCVLEDLPERLQALLRTDAMWFPMRVVWGRRQ